jgi:hypothetical protein
MAEPTVSLPVWVSVVAALGGEVRELTGPATSRVWSDVGTKAADDNGPPPPCGATRELVE